MNNLAIAIISIVLLLGSFWLFNHVNSWMGVGTSILIAATAIVLIVKNFNKNE